MWGIIVVDPGRSRSTLTRTWCLYYIIIALDIVITLLFSINCSTVICSPTVEFAILREATSETYGPRVYRPSYYFPIYLLFLPPFYFAIFIFQSIQKNTKNIYLIISMRSHFRKWSWRDWQPLYRVGCKVLICLCRCVGLECGLLLDWYLGSQNWGKYLRYFAASPFPLQGKTNAVLKR